VQHAQEDEAGTDHDDKVGKVASEPLTTDPLPWFSTPTSTIFCWPMRGRITQKPDLNKLGLGLTTVALIEPLQVPPRYNGALIG
jgi:hypothetical protein